MYAPGKIINLDGIRTHFIEKGSGHPVILVHGFFFDTYMWEKNIDILARRYKVYAIDLWGFGYSSREQLEYGYPLYTKQLSLFMDAMEIPSAILIGQSLGGGTIINFTVTNRSRVDRIVLVDAAGMPFRLPLLGRLSNLPIIGEFLYKLRGDFVRKFTLKSTFLYNRKAITDEFFESITRFQKIESTSSTMLSITRKRFFDKLKQKIKVLGGMNVPTLIIWGKQEKGIPIAMGKRMHEILKNSRFEIIEEAGHCPNIDQPEVFNNLVLEFLSEND